MAGKKITGIKNKQDLYFKVTNGAYDFIRSVYTPEGGGKVVATTSNFRVLKGARAIFICLLNLKLKLENINENAGGHIEHTVLDGEESLYFTSTLRRWIMPNNKFKPADWYIGLFGEAGRFLTPRRSGREITVTHTQPDYPRTINVYLVEGIEDKNPAEINDELTINEIIESLLNQNQSSRLKKSATGKQSSEGSQAGASTVRYTPDRSWNALKMIVEHLSDTKWTRLYAIDCLDDNMWKRPETYAYFGHQAREYLKANYNTIDKEWKIVFSNQVLNAIDNAAKNAEQHFQKHYSDYPNTDERLTAFDHWSPKNNNETIKLKFEIVRVLIWPIGSLLSEEADAAINLHRMFNIPLFYLAPETVGKVQKEEYILLCRTSDTDKTKQGKLGGLAWCDGSKKLKPVRDLNFHALEHFHSLLENQKLLFAIDSREMLMKGIWDSFIANKADSRET